jgi:hypothetical protein
MSSTEGKRPELAESQRRVRHFWDDLEQQMIPLILVLQRDLQFLMCRPRIVSKASNLSYRDTNRWDLAKL